LVHVLPVVQGFDRWDLGLDPLPGVQSKAPKEQHQKHKHHFVEWVFQSVVKWNI